VNLTEAFFGLPEISGSPPRRQYFSECGKLWIVKLDRRGGAGIISRAVAAFSIFSGKGSFMVSILSKLYVDEDGQDTVEYALLVAFIGVAGAAICMSLGNNISYLWNTIANILGSDS